MTSICNISQAGEVTNEVRTVIVKMMCDMPNCKGEMKLGNIAFMVAPPKYPHKCNICNAEKVFSISYPQIRYEEKKND